MRTLLSLGYSSLLRWLWLVRNYRPLKNYLHHTHGIREIRPILTCRWHRGSKYFRAVAVDGESLFIKMDGNHHLLENEVGAWTQLRHTTADASHFLGIRFFDFTGEYRVVALEWMDGEPLSVFLKKSQPKELVLSIIRELVAILVELGRAGIVHRDFTPDNLLVALSSSANPRPLVLIDFACAVIGGVAPLDRFVPLIDLLDLCNGYKPQEYLWDDAYSCLRIYELIDQATGVVDTACQAQVVKRLASLTYSFDKEAAEQVRMGRFETKDTSCE